jgi:tetratricopeptide (TPR) repeat protein
MTQTLDIFSPAASRPERAATGAPTIRLGGRGLLALTWKLIATGLVVGLVGFNVWWYRRDARPLPTHSTIASWITRERFSEAEAALREHIRRSPHDGEARIMLARVCAARGDLLSCARQLHEVPYWWPQKVDSLYREGQAYLMADRAKDAENAWLELINEDPLHPVSPAIFEDACNSLLELYATQDRWEDAYPVIWIGYDHAATADKLLWLTMRMRAEVERISPKESMPRLQRYVQAAPDDWESLRALARAELGMGQIASAEYHYQRCLEGHPGDVRAWRDYLTMLLERGELERFGALLRNPPPSADGEAETWFFRGVAAEKEANWKVATARFGKALELNPFLGKCYYRLATAEERLGLRDQALAHRKKSKEINDARAQLSVAYSSYLASLSARKPGDPSPEAIARRIAAACATLGWARAAQAWKRLSVSPQEK